MSSAINTTTPANDSESGPSSSNNPLQRPRSKSRTIIRMLTTKFSHPSSSSNTAQPSTSTSTPALQLKIPKAPKPKAPPKVAPTGFADPAARAAALRARGLLPPLPVLDLSEQERERDARLPILESDSHSQERTAGGDAPGQEGGGDGEQGETAADRIKREWAARHGIEIPSASAERMEDEVVETEAVVDAQEAEVGADPQRARMRAFKFGGSGSTPPTPTVEAAAAKTVDVTVDVAGPEAKSEAEDEPVTPIGLDIDVSLIDFSEPAPAAAPLAAKTMVETSPPAPIPIPASDAAPTITAADAEGSTGSTMAVAPSPAAHAASREASGSTAPKAETESVRPISIEITPPETLAAPITAVVATADDSDNTGADKSPGSSAAEEEGAHVSLKSENAVSGSVTPRALPPLPLSTTPVVEENGSQDDASRLFDSQLVAGPPADQATMLDVVAVSVPVPVEPSVASTTLAFAPESAKQEMYEAKEAFVNVDAHAELTLTSSPPPSSTPPPSTVSLPRSILTPPTSPSLRVAFSQTPPASPPPVRDLPPIPGATVKLLPSLTAPTLSLPSTSTLIISTTANESKNLQPLPMVPSLSSDTQTSSESDDSIESSASGSTTESVPVVTPVTPAYARSNNPFADPSDANSTPRAAPLAKGKLGNLSVKTHGGLGVLPVLVHSPVTESMQGVPLEVVHEESLDSGWLDSQTTTPAAVAVERNPADDLMESMGLDKDAFSRGLAEDNSLALGLGLDTTSPGTEQVVPTSPQAPLAPLSPNRVPAVTISTPSTGAMPRNKKRGMTDPGTPERRKSLFGGFRKGDGAATNEGGDGTPQRRVSVVASLGNLRRSVVGTISGAEKKERDKKAASRSRSPRRFDASHLPPSPSPFAGFQTASTTANVNMNDAYRNDGMPGSPRTTSSHGSGSVLSHVANSRTVLAPGSAPQLRRTAVPSSPAQRRTAVEPVMYSRGSILLETANIEDEETRRMTEMAFLG